MKESIYKSYDELPLMLNMKSGIPGETQRSRFAGERRNSGMSACCPWRRRKRYGACGDELGIPDARTYELVQEEDFPSLRIGKRIVVPKEELRRWISVHTKRGRG